MIAVKKNKIHFFSKRRHKIIFTNKALVNVLPWNRPSNEILPDNQQFDLESFAKRQKQNRSHQY